MLKAKKFTAHARCHVTCRHGRPGVNYNVQILGHVTSSVTWPFDTPCGVSYRWSMVTMGLYCTVSEIYSLKDIGVTTLTF